jgi:hypothetical protein
MAAGLGPSRYCNPTGPREGRKAFLRTKAGVAELNARLTEGFSDAGIGIVSRWLTSVQSKFPRGEDK